MDSRFNTSKKDNLKNEFLGGVAFSQLVVIYVAISFAGSLILDLVGASAVVKLAVSSLFSVISMFIVIDVFNIRRHEKLELTVYAKKFDAFYILPAIFLAFGMLFGLGFVNESIARLIVKLGGNASSISLPLDNLWHFILFTVLIAVIPAIEEECFFRGLLLGNLTKGKKSSGIIIVALCFALYHGSAVQFVYQFIYGGLLALLTIKAKSVIPAIIAHFINNAFIIVTRYFAVYVNSYSVWIILIGAFLLSLFFLSLYHYKKGGKDEFEVEPEHREEKAKEFFFPYGILGVMITLVIIISGLFL